MSHGIGIAYLVLDVADIGPDVVHDDVQGILDASSRAFRGGLLELFIEVYLDIGYLSLGFTESHDHLEHQSGNRNLAALSHCFPLFLLNWTSRV